MSLCRLLRFPSGEWATWNDDRDRVRNDGTKNEEEDRAETNAGSGVASLQYLQVES